MATVTKLLTADEFYLLQDNGQPAELIRGEIVPMNMPMPRHGQICLKTGRLLGNYAEEHDLGHVVSNDSGVVTEHDPDTVRGADIAFYSYAKVPRGPLPRGYLAVPPDVVFEVRSPGDHWSEIYCKIGEHLDAGVGVVCVLDDPTQTAHLFHADASPRTLSADEELTLPAPLDGFRVMVRRFFE